LHVPIVSNVHGRDHQVHDLHVISNNNVVELFDFQHDGPTFIPPCMKQMNERKSKKKVFMIALANSKLNGQFACHGQGACCLREGL
jgi:hypothetical protein